MSENGKVTGREKLYLLAKRFFDVSSATIGTVIISPVMAVCCIAIVIDDFGNPIFSQTRIGKDKKPFTMYKLRTMEENAEDEIEKIMHLNEMDGPVFKIKDDPRITRVGKFLRKTSLDEFPQFINVIKGDMSMVGPRPPLPREVEKYGEAEHERLSVTPGITCYWQIADSRNDLSFDEWMELDKKYIRERGIKTDIKILLKTIGAVLKMGGR